MWQRTTRSLPFCAGIYNALLLTASLSPTCLFFFLFFSFYGELAWSHHFLSLLSCIFHNIIKKGVSTSRQNRSSVVGWTRFMFVTRIWGRAYSSFLRICIALLRNWTKASMIATPKLALVLFRLLICSSRSFTLATILLAASLTSLGWFLAISPIRWWYHFSVPPMHFRDRHRFP